MKRSILSIVIALSLLACAPVLADSPVSLVGNHGCQSFDWAADSPYSPGTFRVVIFVCDVIPNQIETFSYEWDAPEYEGAAGWGVTVAGAGPWDLIAALYEWNETLEQWDQYGESAGAAIHQ